MIEFNYGVTEETVDDRFAGGSRNDVGVLFGIQCIAESNGDVDEGGPGD